MKTLPLISIIFPNFNGGTEPIECLSSINKLNYPKKKLEIVVVDNGSMDGSHLEINKKFPKVKLIKNKKNLGFAKAINQGAKISKGEYIFITNDDIILEKESLKFMVDFFKKNTQVGILGGKVYSKSKPNKIISAGYTLNKWTGQITMLPNPDTLKEPDWVQGCGIMLRRQLFKKIGFFDEGFTHFFEDFDLCIKVRKQGFRIIYSPKALFWHGDSITANKNTQEKYYQWYKNHLRFIFKHLPITNIFSILLIKCLIIFPYIIIFDHKKISPFLKGLFWNLTHLKDISKLR